MTIKSFSELTKQVHLLNDLILSDMVCGSREYAEESLIFKRRLFTLKHWFDRCSWANKRRYILVLLDDLKSAWALSLLLKSLWNCRPKDAVQSASKPPFLSFYDRTPIDHNRTALPATILGQVMTIDRKWFHSLEPEPQAQVLAELLTIAGGPIMWEVLRRGQHIYEQLRDQQLRNLLECVVVEREAASPPALMKATSKLRAGGSRHNVSVHAAHELSHLAQAQKEFESKLAAWNSIVKYMRDSQKLEELEMKFVDGSKKNIWKVNRIQPENYETVDFLQLLPSYIGKCILSYIPEEDINDYAKVNRYWAYLIDELKTEWAARKKLNMDMESLRENMLKHDISLEVLAPSVMVNIPGSTAASISPSFRRCDRLTSYRASERSAGGVSFRQMLVDKLRPAYKLKSKPIKKLADLDNRLELRGAADENTFLWCQNVVRYTHGRHPEEKSYEGVLRFTDVHFPCPLMKQSLDLPLAHYLMRDPSGPPAGASTKSRPNLSYDSPATLEHANRRLNLWSRNFSSLYRVLKVASYHTSLLQNKRASDP